MSVALPLYKSRVIVCTTLDTQRQQQDVPLIFKLLFTVDIETTVDIDTIEAGFDMETTEVTFDEHPAVRVITKVSTAK